MLRRGKEKKKEKTTKRIAELKHAPESCWEFTGRRAKKGLGERTGKVAEGSEISSYTRKENKDKQRNEG